MQAEAIKLRQYQTDLIQKVFGLWKEDKRRILLQLPTGGGKTVIFCSIAQEFISQSQPVLVIAHREELITQAAAKLESFTGKKVGIIKAGYKPDPSCLVQVASIQSLARREKPPASLVIFDEAHHCYSRTYAEIFKYYTEQSSYILGCTATPRRGDGKGLRNLHDKISGFEELVTGLTVNDLISDGFLSDFKVFVSSSIADASAAGLRTTAGDYNQSDLAEFVKEKIIIGDVVETWLEYAKHKRTVLFAVSVDHSKELAEAFQQSGIAAEHLDGTTPIEERKAILDRFRLGETLVLCQHSIVTEGVDIPLIEAVQFTRPTKSLTIWFQAIGRALRPAPGKSHAIVIDHTDTHLNLPLPKGDIKWSLDTSKNRLKKNITCPKCNHVFAPNNEEYDERIATCPECNTRFSFKFESPKNGAGKRCVVIKILPSKLIEIKDKKLAIIDHLVNTQRENNYSPYWVYYRIVEHGLDLNLSDWQYIAELLGYKPGWGYHKWKELKEKNEKG
jgi:superfamily II DNA or RNA helicase